MKWNKHIWQFILRGRDFILIFNIKDIIKKGVPEKKSLPLKITCHILYNFFKTNQNRIQHDLI
jgi:hypothetical protein